MLACQEKSFLPLNRPVGHASSPRYGQETAIVRVGNYGYLMVDGNVHATIYTPSVTAGWSRGSSGRKTIPLPSPLPIGERKR